MNEKVLVYVSENAKENIETKSIIGNDRKASKLDKNDLELQYDQAAFSLRQ